MESNISKEFIKFLRDTVKKAEPYPLDSEEAKIKYDDHRLNDDYPEKDRINATMALRFLIDNNIPLDEK